MYRALKTFYIIFVFLFYEKRRKLANVFTLILNFHEVNLKNVVRAFVKAIRPLDRDVNLIVNEEQISICAIIMKLIDDKSQQSTNSEISRHNAKMSCRSCFCSKNEKSNLNFDIIQNERYHRETVDHRIHVTQLVNKHQIAFFKKTDMHFEFSVITRLCSILNLMRTKVYDVSHSEWRDLDQLLHNFLITSILNKREIREYEKVFQSFSYSSSWFKIQSSVLYIMFWSLFEARRVFILLSLILRIHVNVSWFRLDYMQTMKRTMTIEISSLRTIVKAFDDIAISNIWIDTQRYMYSKQLHDMILKARKTYQDLIRCEINSNTSVFEEVFFIEEDFFETKQKIILNRKESLLKTNFMKQLFVAAAEFDTDSKLKFMSILQNSHFATAKITAKIKNKRERKFKSDKIFALLILLNVHANLHLIGDAREFVTIMNCNVLTNEMKHMWVAFWQEYNC